MTIISEMPFIKPSYRHITANFISFWLYVCVPIGILMIFLSSRMEKAPGPFLPEAGQALFGVQVRSTLQRGGEQSNEIERAVGENRRGERAGFAVDVTERPADRRVPEKTFRTHMRRAEHARRNPG
jgi:hypothetical protein